VTDRGHRQQEVVRFGVDAIGEQVDARDRAGKHAPPVARLLKVRAASDLAHAIGRIRATLGPARRWTGDCDLLLP
jgi:hypothetical protein